MTMTTETQLNDVQKIDLNNKVNESLVLLKKITLTTNRIKELEDELKLTRAHISMNNNLLLGMLVALGASYLFFEFESLTQLAFFLVVNMGLIASWTSLQTKSNHITSEISEAYFNRQLLKLDVANHSIYQVDINADYTSNDVLAQAENEIKELTQRRYKWG
jgi:hypothetical protein